MGQFCSWRPCAQTRSLGRQASLGLPLQHTLHGADAPLPGLAPPPWKRLWNAT